MLAGRGVPVDRLESYAAEPKLDGWRVSVSVESARVTVRTRHGREITEKVPEFGALAELGLAMVLDGELVAGAGRASDFLPCRSGARDPTPRPLTPGVRRVRCRLARWCRSEDGVVRAEDGVVRAEDGVVRAAPRPA